MNLTPYLSRITEFMHQYNMPIEGRQEVEAQILVLLYKDMFSRLIEFMPEEQQEQANAYVTGQLSDFDEQKHQEIKDFVEKIVDQKMLSVYMEHNLDKVLVLVASNIKV